MLTPKQIDRKIRGAFLPFRCVIEFGNCSEKLHFKVFDHSRRGIVEISRLPVAQVQDERNLGDILKQVRRVVQKKGYALNHEGLCLS